MNAIASREGRRNDGLAWAWLLVGFALLPFTIVQTMLPLAAWLAPVFLLRFARRARHASLAFPLLFLAHAAAYWIALRGGGSGNIYVDLIGVSIFAVFRGLVSTLPYAADRLIGARLAAAARVFVFPLAFTTVDWLMTLLPAVNSTESPVYSQYDSLALMQILSVTGMWGIVFLIGWCAATVNALWEKGFDVRPVRGIVSSFLAVLIAVCLFGGIRLSFAPPSAATVVAATVTIDRAVHDAALAPPFDWVTFNRSSDAERRALRPRFEATADQMLERSETALRAGAKLVGWQETGALILEEDVDGLLDRASALAKRYGADLQVSLGVFTRSETMPYFLNRSILIDSAGSIAWSYAKAYPVFPTESYVTPYGPRRLPVADTPYGRVATAICNDFHFPALIRQAGAAGVDIMMAPYNDLPPFEQQDAVVSIMRAVENGYSMVRATGIGPSLITDYQGRVLARQNYGEGGGVMLASIPTTGAVTIYSRIGDAFAYFCALALLLLGARAATRSRPALAPA
jgi:apolipoprotein N-acyltransferase